MITVNLDKSVVLFCQDYQVSLHENYTGIIALELFKTKKNLNTMQTEVSMYMKMYGVHQ